MDTVIVVFLAVVGGAVALQVLWAVFIFSVYGLLFSGGDTSGDIGIAAFSFAFLPVIAAYCATKWAIDRVISLAGRTFGP